MKIDKKHKVLATMAVAAAALFLGLGQGCTVSEDTGEVKFLGTVPVSEEDVSNAEELAYVAAGEGGLIGLLGIAAGAALAVWRRKREQDARAALKAVLKGTDAIIDNLAKCKDVNGLSLSAVTQDDAVEILKTIQEDDGVREMVRELLARVRAERAEKEAASDGSEQ